MNLSEIQRRINEAAEKVDGSASLIVFWRETNDPQVSIHVDVSRGLSIYASADSFEKVFAILDEKIGEWIAANGDRVEVVTHRMALQLLAIGSLDPKGLNGSGFRPREVARYSAAAILRAKDIARSLLGEAVD